jgi:acetoin utilization protein AcuB
MLVRELMIPKPPVLRPNLPLPEALALMKERNAHRMPVVDARGQVVGIVSETDLHNAVPSPATTLSIWEVPELLSRIKVEDLMVKDVATIELDAQVEEAARIMADRDVSCLPVMDGRTLVGLINQSDVFRAFMELLGGRRSGVRLWFTTRDEKGTIARISSAIAEASGNLVGLGIVEVTDAKGVRWEVTLKVQGVPKDRLVEILRPHVVEFLDVREI